MTQSQPDTIASVTISERVELRILDVLIGERRFLQIRRFERGPTGVHERHSARLNIPYGKRFPFAEAVGKAARLMSGAS